MLDTACNYEWHISGDTFGVPQLVREILEIIRSEQNGLSHEDYGDFRLILNELLYNAVLHGNDSDPSKHVHTALSIEDTRVCISITDEGDGFDPLPALFEDNVSLEENSVRESGRGMKIVTALADFVEYSNKGRTVTIIKQVGIQNAR